MSCVPQFLFFYDQLLLWLIPRSRRESVWLSVCNVVGTLLWVANVDGAPVIGAPGCALFSRATAFDVLLPRLLAGEKLSRATLAQLGAGGLLTKEMSFRFPPYRPGAPRGELQP